MFIHPPAANFFHNLLHLLDLPACKDRSFSQPPVKTWKGKEGIISQVLPAVTYDFLFHLPLSSC